MQDTNPNNKRLPTPTQKHTTHTSYKNKAVLFYSNDRILVFLIALVLLVACVCYIYLLLSVPERGRQVYSYAGGSVAKVDVVMRVFEKE